MIRRHVLAALHAGIEAGDEDAARAQLAEVEWLLRPWARRRLEHALIDASIATGVAHGATRGEARHRLRAAAILVRGAPELGPAGEGDLADPAAAARAYEGVSARPPLRLPIATLAAVLVAAALVIGAISASLGVVTAAGAGAFERPPAPPPVGAFRGGGAPARDAAIEAVLAGELPRLVRAGAARSPEAVAALREHPALAGRGEALRAAWRGFIDDLDRWLRSDETRAGYSRLAAALRARALAVSDQLAAADLGYYIDATTLPEHGRRPPGVATYRIEDVTFVRADADRIRVLGMRRLDQRDDLAALGVTNDELDDPVVLLGQVDEKVRDQILPVIGGGPFSLGDDGWAASRRGRALAYVAGEAIRRELLAALGADASDPERAAARARRIVAASVGRHEAQHGFDQARELRAPQELVVALGRSTRQFALRARLELSAYLSQIASDTWLPQLVLWSLARHGLRVNRVGIEESYVAVVVIEGLARQLGVRPTGPLLRDTGELDRDRLAELAAPLAARSTLELRTAAAALWTELFGRPLVRIYDDL